MKISHFLTLCLVFPGMGAEWVWPDSFHAPPAKVVPLSPGQNDDHAWQTARFRLLSDEAISPELLEKLARTVESVPQLFESLSPDLWKPLESEVKPALIFCRDESAFLRAGGERGTMGYYSRRQNGVIIRADLFLVKPEEGRVVSFPKAKEDLLVHELVHLGMPRVLAHARPWLYEGLAEYVAAAHLSSGRYRFDLIEKAIRDRIRNYLPPGEDGVVRLPHPASILTLSTKEWREGWGKGREALRPYVAALLLIHYQLGSTERRATFETHLTTLQAPRNSRNPFPRLRTDDPAVIAKRLQAYWDNRGLKIHFTRPPAEDR